MNYHIFTVDFLMRDCKDLQDAKSKLMSILPQYPDDDESHDMESWIVLRGMDLKTKETWEGNE
jgi:hypothetical protein